MPSAPDQQTRILSREVYNRPARFGVVSGAKGPGYIDAGGVQDASNGGNGQRGNGLFAGVGFALGTAAAKTGYAHTGQFGAYAEESCFAST